MHLQYLGDALDHWKGSVFEHLQESGALRDLRIDPMASDLAAWEPEDWLLFARLLRVRPEQILHHDHPLDRDRARYFGEIPSSGDLFVDPDTGIATSRVKSARQYLFPAEVRSLLSANPNRLLVVYQHVRAVRVRTRVQQVLACLQLDDFRFACCTYESGTVALLFLSQSDARVEEVRGSLAALLGRHAETRVYIASVDHQGVA